MLRRYCYVTINFGSIQLVQSNYEEVAAKEYDDEGVDDAQDVADDEEVLDKYRKIMSLPELCERWD